MANKYIPINFSLTKRPCLIVGGGDVALRKLETLLNYEGDYTVIAKEPHEKIEYFNSQNLIKLEKRPYSSPEAEKYGMVIAASNDEETNKIVYEDCKKANVPINVVDNPALCDFVFPATLKRGNLSIAISTDGKAPFLAAQLRVILEDLFPERWSKIAKYAGSFRDEVQQRWQNDSLKKAECYNLFLNADWKSILKRSDTEIQQEIERMLAGDSQEEK